MADAAAHVLSCVQFFVNPWTIAHQETGREARLEACPKHCSGQRTKEFKALSWREQEGSSEKAAWELAPQNEEENVRTFWTGGQRTQ